MLLIFMLVAAITSAIVFAAAVFRAPQPASFAERLVEIGLAAFSISWTLYVYKLLEAADKVK